MKKLLFGIIALCIAMCGPGAKAQGLGELNILNHVSVSAHVGTTGFGFEAATPITNFINLRAGITMIPKITFTTDLDGEVSTPYGPREINVDVTGDAARTQGSVILNFYPIPRASLFIAAGLYFGGTELIKITGHSSEAAELANATGNSYLEIGDYRLPFDRNGYVNGALRVASTRPYFGIGFGRAVPNHRVNFMIELGAQIQGKMKICTLDNGKYSELPEISGLDNDDTYQKIINNLKVYPVLKFTLNGRIF